MMAHGRETLAIVVVSTASNINEVLVHNRIRASGAQSVQVLDVLRHNHLAWTYLCPAVVPLDRLSLYHPQAVSY